MKKCYTILLMLLTAGISMSAATQGALTGKFTVNADGKKVYFSQGNLQYTASTKTWAFAANQYDVLGETANLAISETSTQPIDLFGWGTSGYNGRNPWLNTSNDLDYGNPANNGKSDIAGTNYDWGVYNAISNGGNEAGLWRVLTAAEWKYIYAERDNAASLRAKAKVNGVEGLILLPDDWDTVSNPVSTDESEGYNANIFLGTAWTAAETAGAVFLPKAGTRNPNLGTYSANIGTYTTSTFDSSMGGGTYLTNKTFDFDYLISSNGIGLADFMIGQAVRLVQDVTYKVTVVADHCTVTVQPEGIDLDAVLAGTVLTLSAQPYEKCIFDSWTNYNTETGLVVTQDTTVTAKCIQTWTITLPEVTGGHVSVKYKDTDHELTAEELAAVPDNTWVTVTAVPDEGYEFQEWNWPWNGSYSTASFNTPITMVDLTFEPTFKLKTYKLNITLDPADAATIVCKDYYGNVIEDFNAISSASVDIYITPAEGYEFSDISGVEADEMSSTIPNLIRVKVTRDLDITLSFSKITFKVNFRAALSPASPAPARFGQKRAPMAFTGGYVRCFVNEPYRVVNSGDYVEYGTQLRFVAVQTGPEYIFDYWSNNIYLTDYIQDVELTYDVDIVAYFKEAQKYTLTLQDDGNGVVTILNGDPGEELYTTDEIPVYEGTPVILTAHPNLGYEFDHWDNYTAPVFDREMEDWIIPTITSDLTVKAHFRKKGAQPELAEGALPGLFTVGYDDDDKPIRIQFSKGNLQYIAGDGKTHATAEGEAQGTWQFAESQEEYIGGNNSRASEDYEKPIDMFNYGTSGYNGRQPWLIQTDSLKEDIAGTNYDWGVYNAISNGGNKPGLWRTLTYDEWFTLLYNRNFYVGNPQYNCYGEYLHGLGKMFGENGLLLMPDGWVMPGELAKENITFLPNEVESYDVNKYNDERSAILEQSGVVFLPAAGARAIIDGIQEIMMVGMTGFTSSSSYFEAGDASGVAFTTPMVGMEGGAIMSTLPTGGEDGGGSSVRLVRDVPQSEIPTQIENANTQNNTLYQVRKVLLTNGEIRIVLPDGTQYNLQGQKVK